MKKLLLSISFIVCFFSGFSQPSIVQRSTGANTLNDPNLFTSRSFRPPVFADTAAANAQTPTTLDSCGKIIFTYDVMGFWGRSCSPKRWERVGGAGSVSFENSSSINFTGTGASTTPIVANLNVSAQQGNAVRINGDGIFVKNFIQDGIKVPGFTTWINNYNYDVSPAVGVIGGIEYISNWTPITLANADPSLDRIDVIAFNAGGTVSVVTGTPAADPQKPTIDPATQLEMGFVLVTANTTQPPTPPTQDWIYLNNAEWTTLSSTVRILAGSTSNPYSVPLDVQGILAQNGDNIRFTSIIPPVMSNFNVITFKIRSASIWASDSRIELQWYSGATATGNPVSFTNGTYGFTSTNFASYQIATIPLTDFGALSNPTNLLITVRTTGGRTISFYIDDIQLQKGIIPVNGNAWVQGGNIWGTTGVLGTLDNQNINIIANNTLHSVVMTNGSTWMRGTNPGISLYQGTFGIGDYYIKRNTTTINYNSANAHTFSIAGNSMFSVSTTGHTWNSPSAVFQMALTASGELLINEADAGDYKLQVEGGVRFDATSKAITLVGLPTDNTATQVAAKDVSGNLVWRDASSISGGGGAITADNALTMSTATNVQLGSATQGDANSPLLHTTYINTTSSYQFIASGGNATGTFRGINTGAGYGIEGIATSGTGVAGNSTSGIGGGFSSSSTYALQALSNSTSVGAAYIQISSSTTAVSPLARLVRLTTGTVADGLGGSLDFYIERDNGGGSGVETLANQIISTFTTVASATRVSQLRFTGVNNALTSDLLTLNGNGSIRFNDYGTGANTGTPAYTLQVDASGNVIEGSLSGGVPINTLLAATGTNTIDNTNYTQEWQWNTLSATALKLSSTSTAAAGGNQKILEISASGANANSSQTTYGLYVSNTHTGTSATNIAVYGTVSNGIGNSNAVFGEALGGQIGVRGNSASGFALFGFSSGSAIGIQTETTTGSYSGVFISNPSSTNTYVPQLKILRNTSGTAANGIGGGIDFYVETTLGGSTGEISNQIISKYTDVTSATRTSQFIISGVNGAVTGDILTLNGNKTIKANGYGTGGITGTAAFALAVDADGDIIEIALGGGGGGTVNSVAGTLNRITSTGGTDPIIDISASYVGQTSITTVGTIAAGTWQGTAIGDTYISSATTWNAKQSGDATLTALAGLTITNGSLIYGTGADAFAVLAAGTNGQVLSLSGGVPVWSSVGAGTMTTISGVNTNGFTWSIANPTTTPALTLGTSITGILKGNGTAISAAVAGTDYLTPTGSAALLTSFPTLNQNTTGSAATLTTPRNINGVAFDGSANITVTAAAGTLTGTTLNSSVVSSSLTSVGTIASGTWQGTAIGLSFGGTGLTAGGSANQILGMNAAGNASQYKTFTGLNGITITHSVGGVAVSNTFNPTVQTLTDGATITWNVTNGGNAKVTLTGTGRTLVLQNPVAGYTYTIEITQGSGGSKTITTWPTGSTWTGSNTLSTTAGDVDVVVLYYNGTNLRNVLTTDYN